MNKVISKALLALFMVALVSCAPVESSSTATGPTPPTPEELDKLPLPAVETVTKAELATKDVTGGVEITAYNGKDTNIDIPATIDSKAVVSIGASAFKGKSLLGVSLPDSITTIGASAFEANGIRSLDLGSAITTIGNNAFKTNSLTLVEITANTPPSLGTDAFSATTLYVPNNTVTAYQGSANWDTAFTTITTVLTTAVIQATEPTQSGVGVGTISLSDYTGSDPNIIIPEMMEGKPVTKISNNAFQSNNLSNVVFPDNLEEIYIDAFSDNNLTSITLGSKIETLGGQAFKSNSITSVTIKATTVPSVLGVGTFDTPVTNLYVPASSVTDYQSVTPTTTSSGTTYNDWNTVFTNISAITP